MRIGTKISLSFFITAVIVTTIATPVFYLIGKSNLEDAIFSHLITTAKSRTNHIETFLEISKNSVMQLSKSVIFENILQVNKQDPDYNKIFDMAIHRLKSAEEYMENVCEIFVLNKNGKVIVSSNKDNIGLDRSTGAYFLEEKAGPYIKDAYYCEEIGKNSIAISAPILDDESKEILGTVVYEVEMASLDRITIDRTGLGETGEIYLVNKNGYMITRSRFLDDTFLKIKVDTEHTRESFEDVEEFDVKEHEHRLHAYIDYRGLKVLGVHDHIPQMQWVLLAEIDEKEAMVPLVIIKVLAILAIIFIPLTVLLISIFIAKGITRPIRNLRRGVEIVGKGNLDYKVGTDAEDEIGKLTRAFDKMTWDLKKYTTSINSLYREITERKKVEEKLKKAYKELKESHQELIQAEKLAAIGQLATGMAHGINNPLSVISGEAEMLFKDSSKDKDTRDTSRIITEQARRIKSITEGLLGFSHKEEFEQKPLDVNNIIEKSMSLLSYQVKLANIKIIKELEPNLPKILGSDNQLQEVFLCIMLNAIQAMEDGGKLTVRSRYEKKAAIIEFKDTGEGMDKETLKKIFNPFFSTREKGTGLGLSIVDRIIKAHKGIIEAHSKLGEGSTFIIKLAALKEGGK